MPNTSNFTQERVTMHVYDQSTIHAAGILMLSKSQLLLNIKHMLTLYVLEHLNLPPSDYLVIYVTFKLAVFVYPLDAKTVEN